MHGPQCLSLYTAGLDFNNDGLNLAFVVAILVSGFAPDEAGNAERKEDMVVV